MDFVPRNKAPRIFRPTHSVERPKFFSVNIFVPRNVPGIFHDRKIDVPRNVPEFFMTAFSMFLGTRRSLAGHVPRNVENTYVPRNVGRGVDFCF